LPYQVGDMTAESF